MFMMGAQGSPELPVGFAVELSAVCAESSSIIDWIGEENMRSQKTLVTGFAALLVSAVYFWGYSDARQGRAPGLIATAVAAEDAQLVSTEGAGGRAV